MKADLANIVFSEAEISLWKQQMGGNPVMAHFASALNTQKPVFIPIRFFRDFEMKSGMWDSATVFQSSGTTGMVRSQHPIRDLEAYGKHSIKGFHHFYPAGKYHILALLPGYLEREDSSLVTMVKYWMDEFGTSRSGFFLQNFDELAKRLEEVKELQEPVLVIGVTHALTDFVAGYRTNLRKDAIVMETGGMKGRKEELTRDELHERLKSGFGVDEIHSEYGMTELQSQAYATGGKYFRPVPGLRVIITDPWLHNHELPPGTAGRINFVDMANVDTCAFIQSEDLGRMQPDGSFEVLGRLDHAEMRGCSLMAG